MAITRHGIYPSRFTYTGPTTFDLASISNVEVNSATQKDIVVPGGNVDNSAIMLLVANPEVNFDTDDLITVLTACTGLVGLNCTSGAIIQWQKRSDGGLFTGAGTHISLTSEKGFLYPMGIRASQGDEGGAVLSLKYRPMFTQYSGGLPVAPLVIAGSATLVGTPTYTSRSYLGPVYKGSGQIEGVTSVNLDFGIEFATFIADGEQFPRIGSIIRRKPKLTFEMSSVDYVSTIASLFNNASADTIHVYFPKGVHGGGRVAYTTAQHLKYSFATPAWNAENIKVQRIDDATMSVQVEPTGTITANLASAIP